MLKRQVFQAHPPTVQRITPCMVRELYDASRGMRERDRREYFYSNGVDYDMAEEYLEKVISLNRVFYSDAFCLLKHIFGKE